MKASLLGYVRAFALARPPFVTFLCAIFAVTLSLFLVALSVKHAPKLIDIGANEDWHAFLKSITEQKLCILPSLSNHSVVANSISSVHSNISSKMSLFVPINISSDLLHRLSVPQSATHLFKGDIAFRGWRGPCSHQQRRDLYTSNHSLSLTLIVPPLTNTDTTSHIVLCLGITGPVDLLPVAVSKFDQHCPGLPEDIMLSTTNKGSLVMGKGEDNAVKAHKDGWCASGEPLRIEFKADSYESEVYLSESEQLEIYSYAVHAGFLLLMLIMVLLLVAILQGRTLMKTEHVLLIDKEPLNA